MRTYIFEVENDGYTVVEAKDFVQGFESLAEAIKYIEAIELENKEL